MRREVLIIKWYELAILHNVWYFLQAVVWSCRRVSIGTTLYLYWWIRSFIIKCDYNEIISSKRRYVYESHILNRLVLMLVFHWGPYNQQNFPFVMVWFFLCLPSMLIMNSQMASLFVCTVKEFSIGCCHFSSIFLFWNIVVFCCNTLYQVSLFYFWHRFSSGHVFQSHDVLIESVNRRIKK